MTEGGATINRSAVISLAAGALALAAFCIAVVPIPLTGYLCFPGAALTAILAILCGVRALRQIRSAEGRGRWQAGLGIAMGGASLLALACIGVIGIAVLRRLFEAVRGIAP